MLKDYRLYEDAHHDALKAAMALKILLGKNKLNVVTAESLTAGMISKMLVDIPGNGASVYGGFAVYDTDAKRQMLGVKTTGVYSNETAYQMAAGALNNSRAAVSLAVTGNAMATQSDLVHMGQVYFAVGLRIPDPTTGAPFTIKTFKTEVCDETSINKVCNDWKELHGRAGNNPAPFQITSILADYIRLRTVKLACKYAVKFITTNLDKISGNIIVPTKPWDQYCKPSWILDPFVQSDNKSTVDCDAYEVRDYDAPAPHMGGSKHRKTLRRKSSPSLSRTKAKRSKSQCKRR